MSGTTTPGTTPTEGTTTPAAASVQKTEAPPAEGAKTPDATTTTPPASSAGVPPATKDDKTSDKPGDSGKASASAPEELTLKFPEGAAPDETIVSALKPVLKELGLTSDGAQKLLDTYWKAQGEAVTKHLTKQNQEWVAQAKADKDIGGDNFDKTVADARRVYKQFATPAFTQLMEETGLGSHPEMLRVWRNVAKAIVNDSVAGTTGQGAPTKLSPDEVLKRTLYPTMFKES